MLSARSSRAVRGRLLFITLITALAGIVLPGIARAEAPSNDDFDSAVAIAGVPFSTGLNTADATAAADDPTSCFNNGSVWFSFTPASPMTIVADTFGSDYDTVLSAYTGSRGALGQVPGACNDDSNGVQSRIVFPATAGTTYYFLVGQCCGTGGSGGGNLLFSVAGVQGPTNDNFADAIAIPGVPSTQTADLSTATNQAGEPTSTCGNHRTVWYSFTPSSTASVTARASSLSSSIPVLAVYTGGSLSTLTQVACRTFGDALTFRAVAGETYFLQLGDFFTSGASQTQLTLEAAPAVTARFGFFPFDPSTFESVSFFDQTSDPGGSAIVTRDWQFGDGTSGTDCCPAHRYAADGDYAVRLTVTTSDGRTASTTNTISVRTHDVAVQRFTVPQSARAGQTRAITANIRNVRYDDMVQVTLYKSTPNGFTQVGSLTQLVLARPNQTTEFPFNYTFTNDDATNGKVTFKVIASLTNARDTFPADNEVVATPTKVS